MAGVNKNFGADVDRPVAAKAIGAAAACAMLATGIQVGAKVPALSGFGNDTGQQTCIVDGAVSWQCSSSGQDAAFGRDLTAPDNKNGAAGFAWAKLDQRGFTLPANASSWRCVKDRVTGLVWEVKLRDGSVFDVNRRMTNMGSGASDAQALVQAANAERLCGFAQWRLPSVVELQSLLHHGRSAPSPKIDEKWLGPTASGPTLDEGPGVVNVRYWARDQHAGDEKNGWGVGFDDAQIYTYAKTRLFAVRLVHGLEPPEPLPASKRFVALDDGGQVLDRQTLLIWQRCAAGSSWNGISCGSVLPSGFTWAGALAYAKVTSTQQGLNWRLPSAKELVTIVDYTRSQPAIDQSVFPGFTTDRNWFWTSTFKADEPDKSLVQGFSNGHVVDAKHAVPYGGVRLVRDAR